MCNMDAAFIFIFFLHLTNGNKLVHRKPGKQHQYLPVLDTFISALYMCEVSVQLTVKPSSVTEKAVNRREKDMMGALVAELRQDKLCM